MQHLVLCTAKDRDNLVNLRKGETKFGEHVQLITNLTNIYENIKAMDVDYVIFGICEDIGVIANYGEPGAHKAWQATLKTLLNTQSNRFIDPKRILILGHLDYSDLKNKLTDTSLTSKKRISIARKLTETIDADVSHLVYSIIKAGKTPICIGGGHNNAYGNIKGASLALKQPINALNFDAHHDFRDEEGRHSGNGFTYAYNEGFLKKYFIFGLHKNYVSENSLATLTKLKSICFNTFEDISIRQTKKFKAEMQTALNFVSDTYFGLEIDCDAIQNIPSSAMTPSGFSITRARQFVNHCGKLNNVSYLHICEAAPKKKTETLVGKLITYLITDFIRANGNRDN